MRYITCLLLTFLVVACSQPKKSHPEDSLSSDTIRYAQGFTVYHFNDYTSVEVRDPWDSTRLLQRYLLVDRDRPVPGNLPKGTIVQVPAPEYRGLYIRACGYYRPVRRDRADHRRLRTSLYGHPSYPGRVESRTDCRHGRGDRP